MLSNISFDKVSVTATIAVISLSISLIVAVVTNADSTLTIALASGLTGYIGGRASNTKENNKGDFNA